MAGAPVGNTNAAKLKIFEGHLRVVALANNARAMRTIAAKAVEMAESGDMQAMQFVVDRLDGKPKQQVEISGDQDNPLVVQQSYLDALAGAAALRASHTAGLVDSTNPNAYPSVEER